MRAAAPILLALCLQTSAAAAPPAWRQAGLAEREAAAHLLNRFAYGPRPGEIEEVLAQSLDRWFERQLAARIPDRPMEERLEGLPALDMPAAEIARLYPRPGRLMAEAKAAGEMPEDRRAALRFAREQGYRPQRELTDQLLTQKVYRALESENQLAEVMTDFWFNHFNVSLTDNQARAHVLSYERDAIRPHALGRVRDLLGATARHPAMLLYLDNARSSAVRGLNENYARELLELHTLGVDGGYTQRDVVEVARAFTGWTVLPSGPAREKAERRLARLGRTGFHVEGEFLFRADQHDAGAKTVLGRKLPAGRGIEDGEEVLDALALHPATARRLASKLAVRFVSDQPPKALVDRLATVYLRTGGDTRRVLRAIFESPEFWSRQAVGAKIKSPFELAVSAVRATGGEVEEPRALVEWVERMGQRLYAYQAPTGFPDRAEAWVNTGSLLNRMNFGLQLASGQVPGVDVGLPAPAALNGGRRPASPEEALEVYAGLLLPGRNLQPTVALLKPRIGDPGSLEQVVGVILGSPEFQRR